MNDRYRDIYEQAFNTYNYQGIDHALGKFAELIVRECTDLLELEYGQSALTGNAAANAIKRHFGVEE